MTSHPSTSANVINQYYQLCGVRLGTRGALVQSSPEVIALFPRAEVDLYFRRVDNAYTIRETVNGAAEPSTQTGVTAERQPIIIIN